jgi:hypothetical protein
MVWMTLGSGGGFIAIPVESRFSTTLLTLLLNKSYPHLYCVSYLSMVKYLKMLITYALTQINIIINHITERTIDVVILHLVPAIVQVTINTIQAGGPTIIK